MPLFLTGDELGSIKSISYDPTAAAPQKAQLKTLYDGTPTGRTRAIHRLAVHRPDRAAHTLIASAHADGSVRLSTLSHGDDAGDSPLEVVHSWTETRIRPEEAFVGLAMAQHCSVFSCTSNGALRRTCVGEEGVSPAHELSALPSRLADWRLGHGGETFAYGGDEVELSVWDTDRAFSLPMPTGSPPPPSTSTPGSTSASTKKRKRATDGLFPGETWRAKNIPNDNLGLRQPVHNTCLTYLSQSSSTQPQLLAGTRLGDVRRYDTRVGRRPTNNWKGIAKVGGVRVLEQGRSEYEAFTSDQGANLLALDLRNGRTLFSYRGISGAVCAVAPSLGVLASVAQDRYARLHSTVPPPTEPGKRLDGRGIVLEKVYMTVAPTVVVWDGHEEGRTDVDKDADDEIWDTMRRAGSDEE